METFEKVVIKSESDLPKEKGTYIFGWNKTKDSLNSGISTVSWGNDEDDEEKHDMCESFDWYLRPIPESRDNICLVCGMEMDLQNKPKYLCMNPDCENYIKDNISNTLLASDTIIYEEANVKILQLFDDFIDIYSEGIIIKEEAGISLRKNLAQRICGIFNLYSSDMGFLISGQQPKQSASDTITGDLKQYMTNLLYCAHFDAIDMDSSQFDKFVEVNIRSIDEYFKSYYTKPKITDEDIEKWAIQKASTRSEVYLLIEGAKAYRDGLIPPKSKT